MSLAGRGRRSESRAEFLRRQAREREDRERTLAFAMVCFFFFRVCVFCFCVYVYVCVCACYVFAVAFVPCLAVCLFDLSHSLLVCFRFVLVLCWALSGGGVLFRRFALHAFVSGVLASVWWVLRFVVCEMCVCDICQCVRFVYLRTSSFVVAGGPSVGDRNRTCPYTFGQRSLGSFPGPTVNKAPALRSGCDRP